MAFEAKLDDEEFIETCCRLVRKDGDALKLFSKKFRDCEQVVLAAVKESNEAIKYASDRLRNDKNFIMSALQINCNVFNHLSSQWRADKEVILEAYKHTHQIIKRVSKTLRQVHSEGDDVVVGGIDDEDLVLSLLKVDARCYVYISERLSKDTNFALKALDIKPYSYCFFSDTLKENEEITLKAIRADSLNIYSCPKVFKDREDIMYECTTKDIHWMWHASQRLLDDPTFVLNIIHTINAEAFTFASDRIRADRNIVLETIKINGIYLGSAPRHYFDDKEIILIAISTNISAANFVSDRLLKDRQVLISLKKISCAKKDDLHLSNLLKSSMNLKDYRYSDVHYCM